MGTRINNNGALLLILLYVLLANVNARRDPLPGQPDDIITTPPHTLKSPPIKKTPTPVFYPSTPTQPVVNPPTTLPPKAPALPPSPPPQPPSYSPSMPSTLPPTTLVYAPDSAPTMPPIFSPLSPPPTKENGRIATPSHKLPPPSHTTSKCRRIKRWFFKIFPRTVALDGEVYCNCPYSGGSFPLYGATIEVKCKRNRFLSGNRLTNTNKDGKFFVLLPQWATTGDCTAYLVSSPLRSATCAYKTNLNNGISGASIRNSRFDR